MSPDYLGRAVGWSEEEKNKFLSFKENLGVGQTSNIPWDEPNSNLGRPKLIN